MQAPPTSALPQQHSPSGTALAASLPAAALQSMRRALRAELIRRLPELADPAAAHPAAALAERAWQVGELGLQRVLQTHARLLAEDGPVELRQHALRRLERLLGS
jgi:hypothetical protein